jgi:hypothetical protein
MLRLADMLGSCFLKLGQFALKLRYYFLFSESPKGQGNCPRLNGLHKDPKGCGRFYRCENGTAVPDKCPEGSEFDDHTKVCRSATPQEREKCSHSSTASGMLISQSRNYETSFETNYILCVMSGFFCLNIWHLQNVMLCCLIYYPESKHVK